MAAAISTRAACEAGGAVDAVWRPVVGGRGAGRVLDRGAPLLEVALELQGGESQLQAVAVAVQRDRMALREDPPDQRRTPAHLLADDEERGAGAGAGQDLKDHRRALWVGPVVEGDRHRGRIDRARQGARDLERAGGAGRIGARAWRIKARMIATCVCRTCSGWPIRRRERLP